jgi:hypothetical protein
MTGKATLLLMVGFSLLFLVVSRNFGEVTNRAVDNYVSYFKETAAHDLSVSGANLAANQIYLDQTWDKGFTNLSFQGGTINVEIVVIDPFKNIKQIRSTGTFQGNSHLAVVTLAPSKFSKFAYYSVSEGGTIWWTGSDTIWGPFHTQDNLRAAYHPVFYGKASSKKSLIYYNNKNADKPYFLGGYDQGVDLPLPIDAVSSMEAAADDNGLKLSGHDTVYITFAGDSLKYRFKYKDPNTTVYLPTAAPNGLIFAKNCVVRLKGTVKGQFTIGCTAGGSAGKGTIYLDDNIVFNTDPKIDPTSSDLLGICAENNVLITNNKPNQSHINIQASIYCEKGGFGADKYDTRPISGNINLLGGIIQNIRKAVSTFSGTTLKSGFAKRYRYDNRLLLASPPFFPGTGKFEIVSWYE